jgi:hypothetical protein
MLDKNRRSARLEQSPELANSESGYEKNCEGLQKRAYKESAGEEVPGTSKSDRAE